ncbi:MAG: L,D-transpeptidase family protein [Phycisphaerae bacterium]|jgi:D-alanyl-D-alanine dipeptidase
MAAIRHRTAWTTATLVALLAAAGCDPKPASNAPPASPLAPLQHSRQVVLVIADGWDSTTATLVCYARAGVDQPWTVAGQRIPVTLGRTGLAWGRGLHGTAPLPGPVKCEGDGKAPAGVFALPLVFGYAEKAKSGEIKLPYLALTAEIVGVDDANSRLYNQIVQWKPGQARDWDSAETMRRADGLYEWGVVVGHNTSPVVPGAGSCIFMHIWRGPDKPTAGCTAMARPHVLDLVKWLDPQAQPVLVQLPREAYDLLEGAWNLPPSP